MTDKDDRFNMYQWIDKLEYWLLGLPKPDKTIFLHVPAEKTLELVKCRECTIDDHKTSLEHIKNVEESYIELSELYNWDRIECIKNDKLRSVDDINDEIIKLVENMLKYTKR